MTNQSEWGSQPGWSPATDGPTNEQPQIQPQQFANGGVSTDGQPTPAHGIPHQAGPYDGLQQGQDPYSGGHPPLAGQPFSGHGPAGPNRTGILLAILAVLLLVAVGLFFLLRPDGPRSGAADSGVRTNTTEGEEPAESSTSNTPSTEATSSTTESSDPASPETTARVTTTGRRTTATSPATTATTRSTTTSSSTTETTTSTTEEETTTTAESTTSETTNTTAPDDPTTTTRVTFDITIPTTLITIPRTTFSIAP